MVDERDPELLAQMVASDSVRLRDEGVIATWLAEHTEIPNVIEAAGQLIKAQGDAGLITMIKADLDNLCDRLSSGRSADV